MSSRRSWPLSALLALAAICIASGTQAGEADSPRTSDAQTDEPAGHRAALEERGVSFGLATYNDVLAVVDGGLETGPSYPGLAELSIGLDFEHLVGWEHTDAFVRVLGMYGSDPADATGSLNAPSNIANPEQTHRLFEAWIEHGFPDAALAVRVGLIAVDSEFDVKETAGVFMNGGFGTGVDFSQSGQNGPCAYPTSCLGLRVRWQPSTHTYLQAALLDGVAGDADDPRGTHVRLATDEGVLAIGEFGYQRGADEGRFLRAALGVWHYSAPFDDLLQADLAGGSERRHVAPGAYALLEGELHREPGSPTQGLSGFVRVGVADPDVHQVSHFFSAGLADSGLFRGRDEDVTALGVSVPLNGSKFKDTMRRAGTPVEDAEVALELTHWMPVLSWLSLQLDAQYIMNPGTDPAVDDALLFGLRVQATF